MKRPKNWNLQAWKMNDLFLGSFLDVGFRLQIGIPQTHMQTEKPRTNETMKIKDTCIDYKIHHLKFLFYHLWYCCFHDFSIACAACASSSVGSCCAKRSSLNCNDLSTAIPSWAAPFSLGSEFASSVPLPDFPQPSIAFTCSCVSENVWSHSFLAFSTASTTSSIWNLHKPLSFSKCFHPKSTFISQFYKFLNFLINFILIKILKLNINYNLSRKRKGVIISMNTLITKTLKFQKFNFLQNSDS